MKYPTHRIELVEASFGMFVVYGNNIMQHEPSHCIWLIPGTWKDED